MEQQHTLQHTVSISGIGLHTGVHTRIQLWGAPPDSGVVFKRVDLPDSPEVAAIADNVHNTTRCTMLKKGAAEVYTIEHLLAAFRGMGVDNVLVEIDNIEVPIIDGSALPFIRLIQEAGVVAQEAERTYIELDEAVHFYDAEKGAEIIAIPATHFEVSSTITFNKTLMGTQYAEWRSTEDFSEAVAPARTFCFLNEIEGLLEKGLIKGANLENAVVYADRTLSQAELEQLSKHFNQEQLTLHPSGAFNNTELRYTNEAARHKLLDIIGDLTLLGKPLRAKVVALRPGHSSNVQFVKQLQKGLAQKRRKSPKIDIYAPPLADIREIEATLPHRFPFLLVDKIVKLTEEEVIGVKMVTMNEPFFAGHFPGNPIMPGVLQIEAMAQAGGILLLRTVPDPQNYLTFFLKIDQAKFRKTVVPGDVLVLHLKLTSPIRRGLCEMRAEAWVGDTLVTEGILTAKIERKPN
ncbi:MAG: bifunctional UDP-3-O-[3-hydroxymyristoyl] N-acetylglucosamine deacetylase/3-hydroxyacyl-ACP dehydratase [Sphingobacteriales bacterium]|nr:bifunctional UDP-3-O-[3-hydroxymyristoyl] N-acetylglucosamine deacetylase/3-hydroxyacyl-ACP dehydratase [Sphingobacteriales bacterium]